MLTEGNEVVCQPRRGHVRCQVGEKAVDLVELRCAGEDGFLEIQHYAPTTFSIESVHLTSA